MNSDDLEMDKEEVLKDCFEIIRVLGEGSFGKVYLIRNKSTSISSSNKENSTH